MVWQKRVGNDKIESLASLREFKTSLVTKIDADILKYSVFRDFPSLQGFTKII